MSVENQSVALRFIRSAVGSESYCIDLSKVYSIQRGDLLQRSNESDGSIGRLAVAQENIPVFSLQSLLDGSGVSKKRTGPILVLKAKSRWGLMVDRLMGIIEPSKEEIHPMPRISDNKTFGFFKGVIRIGQELSLRLDPERLHPDAVLNSCEAQKDLAVNSSISKPVGRNGKGAESNGLHSKGRILLFSVGEALLNKDALLFGMSVAQAVEILELPPITSVPALPRYVLGLINWRERPVPIIDLGLRLGLGFHASSLNDRLLITRISNNGELAGFPIRSNTKIRTLPLEHRPYKSGFELDESFIRGVFKSRNELLAIPDIRKVFS